MRRSRLFLAMALALPALAVSVAGPAQAPQIRKPRPAPPGLSQMPELPPAAIDNLLEIGGEDINARKANTRLTVEVHVNNRGPYRFLVDSGADTSVVGLRIARDLQLPLGTPVILNAITARNIVDRVRVDRLRLGQSTFQNLQLPALRESDLGGEGMIGIDALVNQRLMMDFERQTIKVEDARIPTRALQDEIVVYGYRRRGQLILTEVKAERLSLDAVIDTGSEITIGNLALRDKLIRKTREKFFTVPTTGVTGETMDLQLARIGEIQIGPITLRNIYVAFADLPPFAVFGLNKEPALLLGTDILENFRRVSLDFRARKARFQLRRCGSSEFAIATTPTSARSRFSSTLPEACRR